MQNKFGFHLVNSATHPTLDKETLKPYQSPKKNPHNSKDLAGGIRGSFDKYFEHI